MKVALPLGRLNSFAIEMIKNFFGLPEDTFNDRATREFYFKIGTYEFFFIKPKDIMKLCTQYNIDYAVISNDHYYNHLGHGKFEVLKSKTLGIQRLSLITNGKSADEINVIATPYINIARSKYPDKEIMDYNSSLEIFPVLNNNCGIIDIVETGETMKLHGLKEAESIMSTEVFLIKRC